MEKLWTSLEFQWGTGERSRTKEGYCLRGVLESEWVRVEYNKKGTEYHEKGLEYSTTRSASCRRLLRVQATRCK